MKSNYVKSLIVSLWIAVLFTGLYTDARSFANWQACVMSEYGYIYDWWQWSPHDFSIPDVSISQNYNKSNLRFVPFTTTWDNIVSWNISLFNNWDYWSCDNYTYHDYTNFHYYTSYNFIKVWRSSTTIDSSWDFYVRNDNLKSYRHVSLPWWWYSENWVSFDMWFPYHGMVFLYDSLSWNTIQLIWDKTLNNKVLYVDPLESDQNVWVLDYYSKKAWSYHESSNANLSTYMFWSWSYNTDWFFDDLKDKFTNSYTIQDWWNFALPWTAIQKTLWHNYSFSTETKEYWKTFTFVSDLNYIPPTWSTPDDSYNSWSVISSWQLNSYEACISDIIQVKNIASLEYACRNTIDDSTFTWFGDNPNFTSTDFENLYNFLLNYNWTWSNPSSKNVSCTNWAVKSMYLYNWNWSWTYYDNFVKANSWSDDPNSIDPVNYCWNYPSSSSEQAWYCRVFNIGCSEDFAFWWVFNTLNLYIRPFMTETLWEYKRAFNSWYNYLWEANKCSSDFYWKSYEWWNFALLFVVAWIWFTLYSVFKD